MLQPSTVWRADVLLRNDLLAHSACSNIWRQVLNAFIAPDVIPGVRRVLRESTRNQQFAVISVLCRQLLHVEISYRAHVFAICHMNAVQTCTNLHHATWLTVAFRHQTLFVAPTAIRRLVARTAPPAFAVWPSGLLRGRPGGLELTTRLSARSYTFLRQFSSRFENFSFLVLLAYTTHQRLCDHALYKFTIDIDTDELFVFVPRLWAWSSKVEQLSVEYLQKLW